ncbi:hypothetical protein DVH24_025237 [Malus domestica]|uniref:MATH domain-containing protein n=1 Tax=Malus domestica TaxID=3750 RepID=A0A498HJT7_MALDO|nr:hypothetical protein DVH24_025237 [Malus domestica]
MMKIVLYPKGNSDRKGTHISLFLALADPETLPPRSKTCVEFSLRIVYRMNRKTNHCQKGCLVETEVTVHGNSQVV